MDKYYYSNSIGFYIGVKNEEKDIELSEEQFNTFNGKKVEIIDGVLVEVSKTPEELEEEARLAKEKALANLTVTTSSGNTFDGNSDARLNLTNAIMASDVTGITETNWKLADNSLALVTVDELKEALALAIQEVGRIVGATE